MGSNMSGITIIIAQTDRDTSSEEDIMQRKQVKKMTFSSLHTYKPVSQLTML